MKKFLISALLLSASSAVIAQEYVTPADMPEAAQTKMYSILTDYNKCMMQGHLHSNHTAENPQKAAEAVMQSCENHLDELKTHLTSNGVESSLVEGMAKSMRSKAARQLMTKTMNNYAAQAAAMANAEKLKEQSANE
ncbi:MAG: hypothetical protein VX829_13520 [Pseudomonadota bacterium]|jgi:hypothetical protein|uniref:Uncharacterized protein n=2 Tax=Methylophaga TaxID=40222 RepID=F5T0F3_9GAMM|nr:MULTISPECIES: hypothetical protein [Methylophaga]MEC9413682.1 hypothetical protein [Pseudomonadota bacterium]EGL55274.1 hypothetical protein MAMP_02268 [Methylophaga aminisulfidivorans MP]WVI84047.1 hypothetical protein VSX76_09700 [Methylophaga thalassica]GLP99151.1 hypothetical protein GCM10007891_10050 [Methylophaga thalassica]HIC46231.1 hypothetical protein [Methylophaga sp.]